MCSMHRLLNPQTCGSAAHEREHFRTLPIMLSHVEKMASRLTDTNWPRHGSVETKMDELRGVDRPQQQQQTDVNFIMPEDKRAYDLFVTAQIMKTDFANFVELRDGWMGHIRRRKENLTRSYFTARYRLCSTVPMVPRRRSRMKRRLFERFGRLTRMYKN